MVCYGIFWSGQLVSQLRACLHGSGGPQVGETTRLGGVKKQLHGVHVFKLIEWSLST